jgi:hypothetical protein
VETRICETPFKNPKATPEINQWNWANVEAPLA